MSAHWEDGELQQDQPPQQRPTNGSVLGPILFLIYINDIPLADLKHICYSRSFADDLATLFTFKKPGRIGSTIKKYIENLVAWFKTRFELLINGARRSKSCDS